MIIIAGAALALPSPAALERRALELAAEIRRNREALEAAVEAARKCSPFSRLNTLLPPTLRGSNG